jgi:hypothetical protein
MTRFEDRKAKLYQQHEKFRRAPLPRICKRCEKNCQRGDYRCGPSGCHAFACRPADENGKCWGFTTDPHWDRGLEEGFRSGLPRW